MQKKQIFIHKISCNPRGPALHILKAAYFLTIAAPKPSSSSIAQPRWQRIFKRLTPLASEEAVSLKKHHQDLKETTSLLVHIYIRLLVYHSLNIPHPRRVLHTVYTHTIHTFSSPFLKVPQN